MSDTPDLEVYDLDARHQALEQANLELERRLAERSADLAAAESALKQRAAELEIISRISQALAQRPDTTKLINMVGDALRDIFEVEWIYIALYDPVKGVICLPYNIERGQPLQGDCFSFGEGLTSHIIQSRQPLLVCDGTDAYARAHSLQPLCEPASSFLGVPILVGEDVIGAICVQDVERPYMFGDSDVRLLVTVAANIGAAIYKTRLMSERERRLREVNVLQDIGSAITSTLDLQDVLRRLHAGLGRVIDVSTSFIGLFNSEQQQLSYPIACDSGQPVRFEPIILADQQSGITTWVLRNHISLLLHSAEEAQRYLSDGMRTRVGPDDQVEQSYLVVPISSGEQVLGVINIQSYEQRAFDQDDLRFVEMVAHQAAIAIRNAQFYAEARRRAEQMAALADVGRDISATLDLTSVLERIAEHARTLLEADTSAVYLPEPGARSFRAIRVLGDHGHVDAILSKTVNLGEGIVGDLAKCGRPEIINDPARDPRAVHIPGTPQQSHERLMVAPLLAGSQVIGMMALWRIKTRAAFTLADLDFLVGLARQASIAIENARLFEEARQARRAAEAANVAKSTFLANMSHELRTPLNAVLGFAQVMERDPALPPRNREHLGIITRSGEHLLGLINDVLEMSKIEAGRVTLNSAPFDLRHLLQGVEEMFRLRAEARGLELRMTVGAEVPRFVIGDENKLRQILINLLGNAVKFTHQGGVALAVDVPDPEVPHRLCFEVSDTGEGIAREQLPHLFQAFVQTSSGARALEGTGLGLAISRQFARLMGGDIEVESSLGAGSTFRATVQLAPGDAADLAGSPRRRVVGIAPDQQQEYRILVVDDKWENRQLLTEWLREVGFAVREASDGQEALAVWEAWEPQLIWMDIRMPVLDGYEATRQIKATLRGQATVVIALTASAFEHDQVGILSAGCDDFVRKPVREQVVFDKIAEHLGVRFVYADAEPGAPAESTMIDPEALLALPEDLRAELRAAVLVADLEQIAAAVERIRPADPALAEHLARLAESFRIDQLLALVER